MESLPTVILCLFIAFEPVNCQRVHRPLQPWMQGVIAVSVFLVLALIAFIVNRLWCQHKDFCSGSKASNEDINNEFYMGRTEQSTTDNGTEGTYSTTAAHFSCEEGPHVYANNIHLECGTNAGYHVHNHYECADHTTDM